MATIVASATAAQAASAGQHVGVVIAAQQPPSVGVVAQGVAQAAPMTGGTSAAVVRLPLVVTGLALKAGRPVTFSAASGRLVEARADTKYLSFVMGIMAADGAAGTAVTPATGVVTLADWTAATGSQVLIVGRPYYLGAQGGLTLTPDPTKIACIAAVGISLSSTSLMVEPSTPIQL